MSDSDTRDEHVVRVRSNLKTELSRALDVTSVEHIADPALFPDGAQPGENDAIFCVSIRHPENDDVFGDGATRREAVGDLRAYLDEQTFWLDALILEASIPPKAANNQSCYFYLQAAL